MPKLPSIRMVDLAKAMSSSTPIKIIGIRPGEKLHEVMCPADDSRLTLEFNDHYVIQPSIKFNDNDVCYNNNGEDQEGRAVELGFEYNSGTNPHFLTIDQARFLIAPYIHIKEQINKYPDKKEAL